MLSRNRFALSLASAGTTVLLSSMMGQAQILPDGTLVGDDQSRLAPTTLNDRPAQLVEGGTSRGTSLFHSFEAFGVGNGQQVYFANPSGILRILGRVTGNSVSQIDGTLGVLGSADLFLLNPNGIVFGPDAQLDIKGSFTATTADSFEFGDLGQFSAVEPGTAPLLAVNIAPGLQYGVQRSEIRNQGSLKAGHNLKLGAQHLDVAGSLEAGRDVVLQGQERLLSGAKYTTGGYLLTQDLNGKGLDLIVPHKNVILAVGDVDINDQGVWHVIAGGEVTGDGFSRDIGEELDRAIEVVSEITTKIPNGLGEEETVTVKASTDPKIDIRSGVDWEKWGGLSENENKLDFKNIDFGKNGDKNAVTGKSITLGKIIFNNGGSIYLSSQGSITTQDLNIASDNRFITRTPTLAKSRDSGTIELNAKDNIQTGNIESHAFFFPGPDLDEPEKAVENIDVAGPNGGDITLNAGGDIFVEGHVRSDSELFPNGGNTNTTTGGIGGNGGHIRFYSQNGGIQTTKQFNSSSYFFPTYPTPPEDGDMISGNGGDIELYAGGPIEIGESEDRLFTGQSLSIGSSSNVFAFSKGTVTAGIGGKVSVYSESDVTIQGPVKSLSQANAAFGKVEGGQGGDINLTAKGNITTEDRLISSSLLFLESGEIVGGNAGAIIFDSGKNIKTALLESVAFSEVKPDQASDVINDERVLRESKGGNGGRVLLKATGDILNIGSLLDESNAVNESDAIRAAIDSSSNTSASLGTVTGGNGGEIEISTEGSIEIGGEGYLNTASNTSNFPDSLDQNSSVIPGNVTGGSGGSITLSASQDIQVFNVDASSTTESSGLEEAIGRDGGKIEISADRNLVVGNISSNSFLTPNSTSSEIASGSGGPIELLALNGSIDSQANQDSGKSTLISASFVNDETLDDDFRGGKGGDITLGALNNISNLEIATTSSAGESGKVVIDGGGNLTVSNFQATTSQQSILEIPLLILEPQEKGGKRLIFARGEQEVFDVQLGGKGRSGDVDISSSGDLILDQSKFQSDTEGPDAAGSYTIDGSGEIIFRNNSFINSETKGEGKAGSVSINATEGLYLIGDKSEISVETIDAGPAGGIEITAPVISLTEGAQLSTSTSGMGLAGNIDLNTDNLVVSEATITAKTSGTGNAGNINIQPNSSPVLNISLDDSEIIAATSRNLDDTQSGKGGNIKLNAPESITITGTGTLNAETSGTGSAGSITVETNNLTVDDGTKLTTTATVTARPPANTDAITPGGSITLQADQMNLLGRIEVISETQGAAPAGIIKLSPNGSPDLEINLKDKSIVSTSSSSSGAGGSLIISAPRKLSISGEGKLSSETSGSGPAGTVFVKAQEFTLQDGAELSTRTTGSGEGGTLDLDIGNGVTRLRNAKLTTDSTQPDDTLAGSLLLQTGQFNVEDSILDVRNAGNDDGGNIEIRATQGTFLSQQSSIQTNATGQGNGGNIFMRTPFLNAVPEENNDIIANAISGNGGNIKIESNSIGNFELIDEPEPALRRNTTNDISASSELGIDGTLDLEGFNVDPSQGAAELPTDFVDSSNQIRQGCNPISSNKGSFINVGRGGIPPQPSEPLSSHSLWEDVSFPQAWANANSEQNSSASENTSNPTVIEAQDWNINAQGEIQLLSQKPPHTQLICQISTQQPEAQSTAH